MKIAVGGGASDTFSYGGTVSVGGMVIGSIKVTPGQVIVAVAGGMGIGAVGGTSQYGNGRAGSTGTRSKQRGAGGAASALYLDGTLLAVGGGGGGVGFGVVSWPLANLVNFAQGGNPGLFGVPGTGGGFSGTISQGTNGNPGVGNNGGNGVTTGNTYSNSATGTTDVSVSGGSGGGYGGGGSGSAIYWVGASGGKALISAGGGGGGNFVSGLLSNTTMDYVPIVAGPGTFSGPGSVVIVYS
ncbi:hypothetical protein DCS_08193 [Drechmeria coniospora]|uniref:Uncharacterized protein n=1 Tax=Drechmeria coniospora TaxID=98403 RepID=A0A151GGL1_DRECN|nr:hypothetical protein DCS_08193 [Drechmeria coniospora]KYK56224.1 hypothetical protein DCS_08193 [Drechmeria coniospora]